MKRLIILVTSLLLNAFLLLNSQTQQKPKYLDLSLDFESRTLDLVDRMTLDEKISQLGDRAPAIPRLDIAEYNWWNECLHGVARAETATVFPQAIAMAASFDTKMMRSVADIISDEARAKHHEAIRNNWRGRYAGLTFWSPNINIFRDPRWGRGHETYGEDPYLTGQMGIQFVKGLQGDDSKYLKVVATAKHFAVHNGPEPSRHSFNAVPNTRDLWETYLPAFEDLLVDAGAYSVMGAYNRVDGESACASWLLLEDILRDKWGFEGYVVSDCGAIRDIHAFHKIVNSPEEASAIGVRKGCDLNCGGEYQKYLKRAVELGLIDEGEIDLSVYRLMLARMKLGMFDPVERVAYAQIPFEVNDNEAHNEMALKMAQKSMTLLKNDGILPLDKKKINKIAIVGPSADNLVTLKANYFGDASHPVTILEGISNALSPEVEVSYSEGSPLVIRKNNIVEGKYLFHVDKDGKLQPGLKGQYFNNVAPIGEANFSRIDTDLNFSWWQTSPTLNELRQGMITPDEAIDKNAFSAMWQGKLVAPQSGDYPFELESSDGSRLYINGELVIDNWKDQKAETGRNTIHLDRGEIYDIKVEYYQSTSHAFIRLRWEIPALEQLIVDEMEDMLTDVKAADVAIFVGGLDASWEGEEMPESVKADGFYRGDRTKIELPAIQMKLVKSMIATGTPIVFVLTGGSSIALSGLEDDVEAVLMAWYPGQRGGDAVADVLFGDYNPAGRLPVTYYSSTEELPDFSDYNMRSGNGFTYRYYTGKALYPFGHGLSYTQFDYSNLKVNQTNDEILVSVTVTNVGKMDGDEVVQLYVKDVQSDIWMPNKQLREFKRLTLKQGESTTVEFTLSAEEDLRYYDAMQRRYMVEPGDFEIQIGTSSEDIRLTELLTIDE